MIISGIVPLDKKRSKIYIDGEFAFVLYRGEIRDYGFRENAEISESTYREIFDVVLVKRCKLRAMNLLQKRDYTQKQLTDKLSEGDYPAEIIDKAIEYVSSYRYLDDERYARDYITYHMESRSRSRIVQDLVSKGIGKEVLMPIIDQIYEDSNQDVEEEQIRAVLKKKHYDPESADYKERQKIMASIVRKGYPVSAVRKAMSFDEFE